MWTNHFIHFFFLTLIDEEKVVHAVNESLLHYQKLKTQTREAEGAEEILFVETCFWGWQRHRLKNQMDFWTWYEVEQEKIHKQELFLSFHATLEPWMRYHKICRPEELLCLAWKEVFQISEANIAKALRLSEGTIRYRVSHGLHSLGEFTESQGSTHG